MQRVLLINQFFWPDLAATSQLLTDLARHLAEVGYDVTVICGSSAYAGAEPGAAPSVRIIRVRSLPFTRGIVARLQSYASFYAGALWYALSSSKPDVVITLTTPPLLSLIGRAVQIVRGSRHYIWEMDLFPEVAVDLGMLRVDSLVVRVTGRLADHARRNSERVIALGECMRQRLIDRGLPAEKITIAENWADGALLRPAGRSRETNGLSLIYPGNLGLGHDIGTLASAMRQLGPDGPCRFLFVGGGPRFNELKQCCESSEMPSATFLPYCGRDRLNVLMAEADIGLVTQARTCVGSLVPSKIYALMAAGLPLLFVGPRSSTPALVIERFNCGWQIDCGDADSLLKLLTFLAGNPDLVAAAGQRAHAAFLAHYDSPVAVRRLASALGLDASGGQTAYEGTSCTQAHSS